MSVQVVDDPFSGHLGPWTDGVRARARRLPGGSAPGRLVLRAPFPVELDVPELARATR